MQTESIGNKMSIFFIHVKYPKLQVHAATLRRTIDGIINVQLISILFDCISK